MPGAANSAAEILRRYSQLSDVLRRTDGLSADQIAERMGLDRPNVVRMIATLEQTGEVVLRRRDSRRVLFRIDASKAAAGEEPLSIAQIFMLHFACRSVSYVRGTGLQTYLDETLERLATTTDPKRAQALRRLDTKMLHVDESPMRYGDMSDSVDEIVTALLGEQAIRVTFDRGVGARRTFRFDPYTLLGHRRGLYLIGYSHHHQRRITLGFDAIIDAERIAKQRFEVPTDYDPRREIGDAFGIMGGGRTDVHVRFDATVARYVMRREWHRTQQFVMGRDACVHLRLRIDGTTELRNLLMSYGETMEVMAPATLREEIARIANRMAARHAGTAPEVPGIDWSRATK